MTLFKIFEKFKKTNVDGRTYSHIATSEQLSHLYFVICMWSSQIVSIVVCTLKEYQGQL